MVRAPTGSGKNDEDIALVHGLPFGARDLLDFSRSGRLDRHLHLHRLENDARLAFEDVVALLHFDFPNRPGDVRTHVGSHGQGEARAECFTQAFASGLEAR